MKPIIFNTEMVQAIQDGRKTMTRRVITKFYDIDQQNTKKYPVDFKNLPEDLELQNLQGHGKHCALFYSKSKDKYYCSNNLRYSVGDKIYVRETWAYNDTNRNLLLKTGYKEDELDNTICYKADYPNKESDRHDYGLIKWKPSIHMPKKHARLFLVVTGVRVERLQDISIEDITEEGFFIDDEDVKFPTENHPNRGILQIEREAKKWWKNLWDSINKKKGFGWSKNPFVVVYEFKKMDKSLVEKITKSEKCKI